MSDQELGVETALLHSGKTGCRDRIWSVDPELELSHYTARRAFPLHFHTEAIVAVIVDGAEAICADSSKEIAEQDSIVIIEPGRPHWNFPLSPNGARYRGFYASASSLCRDIGPLSTQVLHDLKLARDLIEIHRALEVAAAVSVADVRGRLSYAFECVPRREAPAIALEQVSAVAQVLRENCTARLTWGDLARAVDVSAAHLARKFRETLGVPPHVYQLQYRIARAKQMIRGCVPLATVALECGFVDQSHFTHYFRRYVGQTPGAFAREQDFTIQ